MWSIFKRFWLLIYDEQEGRFYDGCVKAQARLYEDEERSSAVHNSGAFAIKHFGMVSQSITTFLIWPFTPVKAHSHIVAFFMSKALVLKESSIETVSLGGFLKGDKKSVIHFYIF